MFQKVYNQLQLFLYFFLITPLAVLTVFLIFKISRHHSRPQQYHSVFERLHAVNCCLYSSSTYLDIHFSITLKEEGYLTLHRVYMIFDSSIKILSRHVYITHDILNTRNINVSKTFILLNMNCRFLLLKCLEIINLNF